MRWHVTQKNCRLSLFTHARKHVPVPGKAGLMRRYVPEIENRPFLTLG